MDRVWARDEEGATGQSPAWGQMPTGKRQARKAGPTRSWEGSGCPRGRPPQPGQDQVQQEQPPEDASGRARLYPDGHGEPKGCRQARWEVAPPARPQSPQPTVIPPPVSSPAPSWPPLPPGPYPLCSPRASRGRRGAPRERLRPGSLPEGLIPGARRPLSPCDSAYPPTLLPSEAPARARPPHRRGQWAASGHPSRWRQPPAAWVPAQSAGLGTPCPSSAPG